MKEDLRKKPRHSSTPRTYILSFDNSTIIPATPEPCLANEKMGTRSSSSSNKSNNNNNNSPPLSSKKVTMENRNVEPKQKANQGGKKNRNDSQTMEHIMAERRRRQELTEKFIALSATIPDLKKVE
ncbi:hypothetical protein RIF29_28309 [Crotalaria pallida]|uniref:BHLH domain-containing protein n=1 Tax=Crotalaria pallida TaxID=3830 RepID=A0AAN9I189_CROPI